ncbi:hypothetical protein OPT61_g8284 [Boeremia exigua]|uniref:Uncharacterized protein n=1 Tax=Boeremia exigua TaxID=749465 RepID=A0ACC2HZR6_9PLEO|nr:hypothetical protein OPT61_g8284 [Boeremia exigua]
MPPKGKGEQPKVKKVAIDKTFGMKNKKGGAAQKAIKQIHATTASGGTPDEKRKAAEKLQKEKEKKAAEDAKKEMADLFKPVQVQKVPFGVDPKTVLCQFFKKGNCEKGKRCKFSHDLNVERKTEKRSLYTDSRDQEKEEEEERKKKDNMDDWDEEKLRNVVLSKHGNPKTTTDKVCKYFIQAIEDQKYGWFWTCPNGGDKCMYKHSLPPGYASTLNILTTRLTPPALSSRPASSDKPKKPSRPTTPATRSHSKTSWNPSATSSPAHSPPSPWRHSQNGRRSVWTRRRPRRRPRPARRPQDA